MEIETKLLHMLQVLAFSEFPNKGALIQAYEDLKKIFISPLFTESLFETINGLKSNLFYKEFELEDDPQFFLAILKKVDDYLMLDEFLKSSSEIKYSNAEKKALEQGLSRAKLLLNLDNDLRNVAGDFYEMYSKDFDELKEILFSEKINYNSLKWFLKSNFSKLVPGSSSSFNDSLHNVFVCLLENASPKLTKGDVNSLTLIIQKNARQKTPMNHNMFFCEVPLKEKKLSKIVKVALENNLEKYIVPTNGFRH
ncbi:MAG: hypothetical protein RJA83_266 [Pseudomonadota bacterium]|jgi:hypothetical protein